MDEFSLVKDGKVDIRGNPADKDLTGRWRACFFILGTVTFERLAFYGVSTNLVNYFRHHLHQGNATAAKSVTNWAGTVYALPLFGAFIADAYWGRYWVIAYFSIFYSFGMMLMALSGTIKTPCEGAECQASSFEIGLTFVALYMIAIGVGGLKPSLSSFGADQFDESDDKEVKAKSSFFNYFYFAINVGSLIAASVLVYIQLHIGWGLGLGLPAAAMCFSAIFFYSGSNVYRLQKPGGSPIRRMAQVLVAAIRKHDVEVPMDDELLFNPSETGSGIVGCRKLKHTENLSCLDKAAVPTEYDYIGGTVNRWRLCTVTQIEELKAMVRLLPVWATGIVFATVYCQMSTVFVLQGNTMNQHIVGNFRIPAASLNLFDTLSVIFWVPVYDKIIVPKARRYTGNASGFTALQRMGIGLVISIICMFTAGMLEVSRLDMVKRDNLYDAETVPMSILWQLPQYMLIGCAEVFTFIGQLDFFYDQAPDAMRSLASALALVAVSLGNYLSSLLVTIVTSVTTRNGQLGWIPDNLNRGHLDYFYWALVVLSTVNFLVYIWIAKRYTYKKVTFM